MRSRHRHRITALFVTFLFGVATASCKSNTIDNDTNNTAGVNVIGPQGGVVVGPEGASVRVPAGALTKDETISIRIAEPREYPPFPGKYENLGKVFAFEPHGLKFLTPAVITLPSAADGRGNAGLTGLRAEGGGPVSTNSDSWQPIAAQVAVDAQIATPSFSYYTLAREAGPGVDAGPSCSGRNFDQSAPSATLTGLGGTIRATGPAGTGNVNVDLATLVDGYATLLNAAAGGDASVLTLRFTSFTKACGYVKNGVQKHSSTEVVIRVLDLAAPITTTTYNSAPGRMAAGGDIKPDANGACGGGSAFGGSDTGNSGSVTITALSATRVAGTFTALNVGGGAATNVSGSFDLPICEAAANLNPPLCCIP